MAVLPIMLDPHPVLRRKAQPVRKVNAAIRQLLKDMADTMYDAPGIGLAAPQVGIAKRVIVVDVRDERGLIEMVNPVIVAASGWESESEGCLSIPDLLGDVFRYTHITVEGLDRHGKRVFVEAEGMLARCFQHEIDHLDGVLYTDKAANIRAVVADDQDADAQDADEGKGDAAPAPTRLEEA